jgi:leucyl aminopeptidase (aminopeptidase T)
MEQDLEKSFRSKVVDMVAAITIERSRILGGVKAILGRSMQLRQGETLLIITDVPTAEEWRSQAPEKLEDMVKRNLLAKAIVEIAGKEHPRSDIVFQTYPSVGRHSAELGRAVRERMAGSDAVLAVTTYSLSHTDARKAATEAGARVASMPGVLAEMFYPGGPMTADYKKIESETLRLADALTEAQRVRIRTEAGTDLTFSLEGRRGQADTGLLTERGSWGNLPAGEAYAAPIEGSGEGAVVVEPGCLPGLKEKMRLTFKSGELVKVSGGGAVGVWLRGLLKHTEDREPYVLRRNLAEFGIGTNPNARRLDNTLEAEKIRGTVHVAVGSNYHIGGWIKADLHQDFVIPLPTVEIDSKNVIVRGRLRTRELIIPS